MDSAVGQRTQPVAMRSTTIGMTLRAATQRPGLVLGGLALLALAVFLALLHVPRADGQLVGSDGTYYYCYVRSLAIDHDLDFADEYDHFGIPATQRQSTSTGLTANKYAIGPALLWLPFFFLAHLAALAGRALGLGVNPDGYGWIYQAAISVGSILYGSAGFWLSFRSAAGIIRRPTQPGERRTEAGMLKPAAIHAQSGSGGSSGLPYPAALAATVLIWLAGNAGYYMVFEPSMAHMLSLFCVAALLSIWAADLRGPCPPALQRALALGISSGMVALVRQQDALVVVLPMATIGARVVHAWRIGSHRASWGWLRYGMIALGTSLVVFTPQILAWNTLYGVWLASPYLADHNPAFYWSRPQLAGVLFSSFHGLFSWHPIYLAATIGLILLYRRERWLALGGLAVLALNIYVVAAWWAWWQGDSFGGRMFLSATWLWVLGLATLLDQLRGSRARRLALAIGLLLICWNGLAVVQYRLGLVPRSAPLTWQQMTIERLQLPLLLFERRGEQPREMDS